jgi:hypothetical protein
MTTYDWAIANLDRHTSDGIVFSVHWTLAANDGTYASSAYGSIGFERPRNLVPYANLTEEMVIEWVKEALTPEKVADIEAVLQQQISEERTPTKAAGVPWV